MAKTQGNLANVFSVCGHALQWQLKRGVIFLVDLTSATLDFFNAICEEIN